MVDGVVTVQGSIVLPDPRFDDQTWRSCPVAATWSRSLVQITEAHQAVKAGLGLDAVVQAPSAACVEGVLVLDYEIDLLHRQQEKDFWDRHNAGKGAQS